MKKLRGTWFGVDPRSKIIPMTVKTKREKERTENLMEDLDICANCPYCINNSICGRTGVNIALIPHCEYEEEFD